MLTPTFNKTITVLNKLAAKDSATGKDVWYKTVLTDCSFMGDVVRNATGNTVGVGNAYVCRIPKNDNYLPYSEWRNNRDGHFTLNVGDYVFLGTLAETEIPTPNTIQAIYQAHKDTAFVIKAFSDNTGTIGMLQHYRVDGV